MKPKKFNKKLLELVRTASQSPLPYGRGLGREIQE